ncbi:MAG: carboxymuconolactone decarboxylase family protein, partial [Planctomycetota bacterium]
MARIAPVTPENVNSKSEQLLQGVEKALGVRPNMLRAMGQSPAVLGAYVGFGQALGGASISGALREQIALTVAGVNSCDYCASAHTLLGKGAGVEEGELADNLRGASS